MIVKIVCAAVEERSEYSVELKSIFSRTQGGHFHYKTLGVIYNKWCFESYVLIGHKPNFHIPH